MFEFQNSIYLGKSFETVIAKKMAKFFVMVSENKFKKTKQLII